MTARSLCISICAIVAFLAAPAATLAATINVSIGDDYFSPKSITIQAGDTVVWTNSGSMQHSATADDGSWDSGTLSPGASYSHTFGSIGTIAYYCKFHGGKGGTGMAGTVVVSAQASVNSQTSASTASSASYAQQVAQLQAEVVTLTKVLQQLLAQKTAGMPSISATAACTAISGPLGSGSSGTAVSQLQAFLASAGFLSASPTGYYGSATVAAVQQFQTKSGIASSGSPASNGFGAVGPKTLAAIKAQCGGVGAQVGAFMQVSPTSGKAPLQVNVQATVNTTNSCIAASYALDWGDQTQIISIPVPSGACQPLQQTYTHTYTTPAAYEITLSAGDHSSQATVVAQQ